MRLRQAIQPVLFCAIWLTATLSPTCLAVSAARVVTPALSLLLASWVAVSQRGSIKTPKGGRHPVASSVDDAVRLVIRICTETLTIFRATEQPRVAGAVPLRA